MIKYSELEDYFAENGITIVEYNIEDDNDIETPAIVYIATGGDSFNADGINYLNMLNISLAIVDQTLNFELQGRVETLISAITMGFDKNIAFSEEERLYSISYSFQVFDG